MEAIKQLAAGVIGGMTGAAAWVGAWKFAGMDLGWGAAALGVFAGVAVRMSVSRPGQGAPAVAALLGAMIAVGAGKFGAYEMGLGRPVEGAAARSATLQEVAMAQFSTGDALWIGIAAVTAVGLGLSAGAGEERGSVGAVGRAPGASLAPGAGVLRARPADVGGSKGGSAVSGQSIFTRALPKGVDDGLPTMNQKRDAA